MLDPSVEPVVSVAGPARQELWQLTRVATVWLLYFMATSRLRQLAMQNPRYATRRCTRAPKSDPLFRHRQPPVVRSKRGHGRGQVSAPAIAVAGAHREGDMREDLTRSGGRSKAERSGWCTTTPSTGGDKQRVLVGGVTRLLSLPQRKVSALHLSMIRPWGRHSGADAITGRGLPLP
jgi:hypothetical protein